MFNFCATLRSLFGRRDLRACADYKGIHNYQFDSLRFLLSLMYEITILNLHHPF